jgi:hypothetical protein
MATAHIGATVLNFVTLEYHTRGVPDETICWSRANRSFETAGLRYQTSLNSELSWTGTLSKPIEKRSRAFRYLKRLSFCLPSQFV